METQRGPFEEPPGKPASPYREEEWAPFNLEHPDDKRLSVATNAIGFALNEDRADDAGVVQVTASEAALHRKIAERVVSQLDEYDRSQGNPEDAYILRPGDVLIIRVRHPVTAEQAQLMKERALGILPGIRDVLILHAEQMEVYRDGN